MSSQSKPTWPDGARELVASWLPALLCMAAIFFLSSQSALGGMKLPPIFQALRKSAHIAEYGLLGVLFGRALVATWRMRGEPPSSALLRIAWWLGSVRATGYGPADGFIP